MFTAIAYDRTDLKAALDSGINAVELRLSDREDLDWMSELTIREAEAVNSIKLYQDNGRYIPINIASVATIDINMSKKAFGLASTVTYLKPSKKPVRVVASLLTGLDAFCSLDPNGNVMKTIKANISMLLSAFPNTKLLIENAYLTKGMSSAIDLHMFISFMYGDQISDRIRLRFNSENAMKYSKFCSHNTPDDKAEQDVEEYERYFKYLYRYIDDVEFDGSVFAGKHGAHPLLTKEKKEHLKVFLTSYNTYLSKKDILIKANSYTEDEYLSHRKIAIILSSLLSSQRISA